MVDDFDVNASVVNVNDVSAVADVAVLIIAYANAIVNAAVAVVKDFDSGDVIASVIPVDALGNVICTVVVSMLLLLLLLKLSLLAFNVVAAAAVFAEVSNIKSHFSLVEIPTHMFVCLLLAAYGRVEPIQQSF